MGDAQLFELAEILAAGGRVPEHLRGLLEQAGRDSELLARLEGQRVWCQLAREAAQRDAQPSALLVLRVLPGVPEPRVEVLTCEGWLQPILVQDVAGGVRVRAAVAGVLRLGDVDLSIASIADGLLVQLHGPEERIRGVAVEATNASGECIARAETDARGVASLHVPHGDLRVVLGWSGGPPGGLVEIGEV